MGQQRAAQQAVKRALELAAQVKAGHEAVDGKGQVGGEQGQASNEVQEQSARPVVEGADASCIVQTSTAAAAAAPKPGPAPMAAVAAAGASGGDDSTSVLLGSGDKDLSVGAQPAEDGGAGTLPGGAGKGSPAGAATCCPEAAEPAKPDAKVLAAAEAVQQLREEARQLRAALAACRARKEVLGAKLQRAQRLADLQVRCKGLTRRLRRSAAFGTAAPPTAGRHSHVQRSSLQHAACCLWAVTDPALAGARGNGRRVVLLQDMSWTRCGPNCRAATDLYMIDQRLTYLKASTVAKMEQLSCLVIFSLPLAVQAICSSTCGASGVWCA